MLSALARLKEDTGHLDDALRLRQQAVLLADAQGVAWRRSEARASLAYTLLQAREPDAARRAQQEGLAMAQAADDALALAHAWNIAAFVHDAEGNPVAELAAMRAAIAQARRGGSRELEVLGLANLSDHFLKRGQYAVALAQAREALPLARALGDTNSESVALSNIGLALVSLHRLDEGMAHLREALALELRGHAEGAMALLVEEQGAYLERAGYLREAHAAYQQLRPLSDALAQRTQQEAVMELQERFDSDRRQRELALLQREGQLQETRLHNQALQQRLWIAAALGGVLLLALGALLLRRLHGQRRHLVAGNAMLLHQSERDPLTGLANRRHLLRRMAEGHATGAHGGLDGALMLIDLDHFKHINDAYGHHIGDEVLQGFAQAAQATFRETDVICRWGGEEFLVLMRDTDPAMAGLRALTRLREKLAGLHPAPHAPDVSVTFSCGVTLAQPGEAISPMLERADKALYAAKAAGRDRACDAAALGMAG
jgi:diguanylate cyclase (GGDEF)-like protein